MREAPTRSSEDLDMSTDERSTLNSPARTRSDLPLSEVGMSSCSSLSAMHKEASYGNGSTRASSSTGDSCFMRPLLRVSPPAPAGNIAGRYEVIMHRATLAQRFGLSAHNLNGERGPVVIAQDEERIGLRKGDEVLRLNDSAVCDMKDFSRFMEKSLRITILLHHHEEGVPSASTSCAPEAICGVSYHREVKPFGLIVHSMRDLLMTSGPMVLDPGSTFTVQISRSSLMQSFDLALNDRPSSIEHCEEGLFLREDALQYGLRAGDKIVRINGRADLKLQTAQEILAVAMNVSLECYRLNSKFKISEALQLDDLEAEHVRPSACCTLTDHYGAERPASRSSFPVNRSQSWFPGLNFFCCTEEQGDYQAEAYLMKSDLRPKNDGKVDTW